MSGGDFSLLGFAGFLAGMVAEVDHAEAHSLERACDIVLKEVKGSLGTYQGQSGPFAAWAPLAEATKADRVHKGYPEDEPELRDGTLRESYERTVEAGKLFGRERSGWVGSNLDIAEFQELGTSRMPPRSILGGAAARKSDEVAHEIGESYVAQLGLGDGSRYIPIKR